MPAEENMKTGKASFTDLFNYSIYVISDSVAVLKKAIDDGARVIQLRDKSGDQRSIIIKARELIAYKENRDFIFILNDDPDLAAKLKADGVHIGQDLPLDKARAIVGPGPIIGRSTHSLEQGLEAEKNSADYISVGPVFPTPTKPDRPAVGMEYVRAAAREIKLPFVAIGGIELNNVDKILNSGAKTIGVVRAAGDVPLFLEKIRRRKK
jgi:thiamine-phosphate pyrophosphorylase